ncbi:hypothetical protein GCM10028803_46530 [Larkinella knui]
MKHLTFSTKSSASANYSTPLSNNSNLVSPTLSAKTDNLSYYIKNNQITKDSLSPSPIHILENDAPAPIE